MAVLPPLATVLLETTPGGGTYAAAGNVRKITPPKMKRGKAKTSHLGVANRAHTYLPGWIDADTFKAVIEMKTADFNTILGYWSGDTSTLRGAKIRYNDGTGATTGSVLAGTGFIMEIGDEPFDYETEDEISTEVTFQFSGLPVFSTAT